MLPQTTSPLWPTPSGWFARHYAILSDGTLVVIVTDVDIASEWARIVASEGPIEPPSRINGLAEAGRARLLTWNLGGWKDGPIVPLETPYPLIDRFTDGRWLVVGARTNGEPNARVLDPDGALLDRFMLGDGIEHIGIDGEDRIWVGWFDEGIFGTGWSVPDMEWPPSSNGVACFAADGRVLDMPSWPKDADLIADCYALTPANSGVWVSPYMNFPLVRFVPGEPARWWRNELSGLNAIAVESDHALIAGGYGDDAARLALIQMGESGEGEDTVILSTWRMPLRPGRPSPNGLAPVWERPALLTGRGNALHLVHEDKWHQWRVSDALAALAHT